MSKVCSLISILLDDFLSCLSEQMSFTLIQDLFIMINVQGINHCETKEGYINCKDTSRTWSQEIKIYSVRIQGYKIAAITPGRSCAPIIMHRRESCMFNRYPLLLIVVTLEETSKCWNIISNFEIKSINQFQLCALRLIYKIIINLIDITVHLCFRILILKLEILKIKYL